MCQSPAVYTWIKWYIYTLPDRCTIYLLAIGLQTLHDSGDSKFIVSFGTIQSPVYGTVCYNRRHTTTMTRFTLLLGWLYRDGTSFCQGHHRPTLPMWIGIIFLFGQKFYCSTSSFSIFFMICSACRNSLHQFVFHYNIHMVECGVSTSSVWLVMM